jgi:outer membrane receptor protein involved in Fe transport
MSRLSRSAAALTGAAFLFAALPTVAQQSMPTTSETIEVTATRVPEDVEEVPVSITVLGADELAARGVTDLAGALSLVAGVSVAPGGDAGPASSVPELWGLKEFDAFLLVVDGVPWGGAFNPALGSLDLTGVERVEVLRGAAPVVYGATSFVGVIQVIHRGAGTGGGVYSVSAGSYGSVSASVSTPLPSSGHYRQSINVSAERQGFKDDRTQFDRGQVLYRGELDAGGGTFHFDLAGTGLRQDPASPHPREGQVLSPDIPLDANHNPGGAHVDEDRYHLVGGYDHPLGSGNWSTMVAYTRSKVDTLRGFLAPEFRQEGEPNAHGFEQERTIDDVYFETQWAVKVSDKLHVVAGIDHLYGSADSASENFEYRVALDGSHPPSDEDFEPDEETHVSDKRNFSGVFLQAGWTPAPRWDIELGLRVNHTREERDAGAEPLGGGEPDAPPADAGEEEGAEGSLTTTRGSGFLGVNYLAWEGSGGALWVFADYRNTFKPAAIDFGPEAEGDLLAPETAKSYEVGLKGRSGDSRVVWQVSAFQMDFENLVVSQIVDGLPGLINAGTERFRGGEVEVTAQVSDDLTWQGAYSRHDAKFNRFTQLFDGVPFKLDGNFLEMSARNMAATGLSYRPAAGWTGHAEVNYVGERFLTKRNTATAPAYTTWSAGVGYRFAKGEVRLDGTNLNDTRPPVSESELGDAQYYLLPARAFRLVWIGGW